MIKKFSLLFAVLIATISLQAEEVDFTDRTVTDPLLKISTMTSLLPESDDKRLGAKRDEKRNPPIYRRIFSRSDVFMLEPFSQKKPAQIDFSEITKNHAGELRISARNHPSGDFVLEIYKNGEPVEKQTIGSNKWEKFSINFDHEPVVIKNVANGWHCEFAFIDYSFAKKP